MQPGSIAKRLMPALGAAAVALVLISAAPAGSPPWVASLSLNPSTIVMRGCSTGRVSINAPAATDTTVTLTGTPNDG